MKDEYILVIFTLCAIMLNKDVAKEKENNNC